MVSFSFDYALIAFRLVPGELELFVKRTMFAKKSRIREQIRSLRSSPSPEEGQRVCCLLADDPGFQKAEVVALYASLPDEITTQPIDALCRCHGKQVVYPRRAAREKRLEFFQVDDLYDRFFRRSFSRKRCLG